MRTDLQRFRSVRERDIDHLVLEEVTVSPQFREWLLQKFDRDPDETAGFIGAWHSVSDTKWGESDIEFGVSLKNGARLLVMIENKIDAPFQDEQLERYQERGQKAIADEWDSFRTCLFAPETYLTGNERTETVDTTLTYECVRNWFSENGSRRSEYRAEVLTHAIEQGRRGYTAEPDEAVTTLHQQYWIVARENFPGLGVNEPSGVPSNNLWVRFEPSALPNDVTLIHKMGRGDVDLQFSGAAEREDGFREQSESLLERDMQIVETGKSLSIRITVPQLSPDDPAQQEEGVRSGLTAANRLLTWYEQTNHDPTT